MSATIDCARASGKHGKLSTIEPARLRCQAAPRAQAHARQLLPCPGRQARADAGPTPAGPAGDGRSAYVGQSVDALRRLGVGREAYLDAIGRGGHVNEGRKKQGAAPSRLLSARKRFARAVEVEIGGSLHVLQL